MAILCETCGEAISIRDEDNIRFCPYCGSILPHSFEPKSYYQQRAWEFVHQGFSNIDRYIKEAQGIPKNINTDEEIAYIDYCLYKATREMTYIYDRYFEETGVDEKELDDMIQDLKEKYEFSSLNFIRD